MKIFSGSQTAVFLPGRGGGSVRCIVRIDLAIEDEKNWRTFSVEIYSILSILYYLFVCLLSHVSLGVY